MRYVFQLTNDEQLLIVEKLVKKLRKQTQTETVVEVLTNALHSRLVDLEDAIEVRFCDECGKLMVEGYCIEGGSEYYCSDECLYENYSKEEYEQLSEDEEGDTYYTTWED